LLMMSTKVLETCRGI